MFPVGDHVPVTTWMSASEQAAAVRSGEVSAAELVEASLDAIERLAPSAATLATDGFLTRTVADTALALDIAAGYEWGDFAWPPPPSSAFADAVGRDPGRLRVGVTTVAPNGAEVHPECIAAA